MISTTRTATEKDRMSFEEKRTWLYGVVAVLGYAAYVLLLLPELADPIEDTDFAGPMLWSIGGAIAVGIVGGMVLAIGSPTQRTPSDERDRQIHRFGEYIGHGFVVLGAVVALLLAMLDVAAFWIANAVYLAFVLSAILSSVARLIAYRRGFQEW